MSHADLLSPSEFLERLCEAAAPAATRYFAMYSSVARGIVTDPALMVVPVDDHLVHRGDGVFETAKFLDGALYNLDAHLDRLFESASALAFPSHFSADEVRARVLDTCRASHRREGCVRILLSRGTGSMGVNPYECPAPHLYIVVYRLPPSFMEAHPEGASARTSQFPVKMDFLARVKSCNYLLNALMRKEAADHGVDFAIGFDDRGFLAEGPTESVGLVTPEGDLLVPRPERILPGTTLDRALDLAGGLREAGRLRRVGRADLDASHLRAAREILIFGTTTDVTSVVQFDGRPVGEGVPGKIGQALRGLLVQDILTNPQRRTAIEA